MCRLRNWPIYQPTRHHSPADYNLKEGKYEAYRRERGRKETLKTEIKNERMNKIRRKHMNKVGKKGTNSREQTKAGKLKTIAVNYSVIFHSQNLKINYLLAIFQALVRRNLTKGIERRSRLQFISHTFRS
jgi:hypothetical protein